MNSIQWYSYKTAAGHDEHERKRFGLGGRRPPGRRCNIIISAPSCACDSHSSQNACDEIPATSGGNGHGGL